MIRLRILASLGGVVPDQFLRAAQPLAGEITDLQSEPARICLIYDSGGLVSHLIQLDLIGALKPFLDPVIVRSGQRLFGGGTPPKEWRLAGTHSFE